MEFSATTERLTLTFNAPISGRTIFAQDILANQAKDITAQVTIKGNTVTLPGSLIKQIGLEKATPGDKSDPGMVISISGAEPPVRSAAEKAPAVAEPPAVWSKPADIPNDTLVSPEVSPDGRVTFRLYAPEARNVTIRVNSDFGNAPIRFVKDSKGVWSATTGPVPSGAYRYT